MPFDAYSAVHDSLGIALEDVHLIPTDEFNEVYRATAGPRNIIIKFESRYRVLCEPWAYRKARAAGVPVPEVLAAKPDAPAPFMIVTEADGVELQAHPAPFEDKVRAYRELGEIMRLLHSVQAHGSGSLDETALIEDRAQGVDESETVGMRLHHGALDYLVEKGLLSPGEGESARAHINNAAAIFEHSDSVVLHGDLGSDHVFVDPDTLKITALIDFGDVRAGDPAWEFVCAALHEPAVVPHLIAGYDPSPEMRSRLPEKLALCGFVRLIGEARWMHQRNLDISDTIERIRGRM